MEASETARLMSGIPDIPQVQNARQATELAKIKSLDELIEIWRIVNELADSTRQKNKPRVLTLTDS